MRARMCLGQLANGGSRADAHMYFCESSIPDFSDNRQTLLRNAKKEAVNSTEKLNVTKAKKALIGNTEVTKPQIAECWSGKNTVFWEVCVLRVIFNLLDSSL